MREASAPLPRRELWRGIETGVREDLVADALDANDRDHNALWSTLQNTNKLLIGVLVSTTTASILLAVNIAIGF